MERAATAARLERWALDEGFDRAGVARLRESDHADVFRGWIQRREHAGMHYLEGRERERLDPRHLFDGARSVLCVALQYHPPAGRSESPGRLLHHVARYARGRDYHDTMKARLDRLADRIAAAYPGVTTRAYVDTGPVLERELAARAGIGSFGKNTNLLHPEAGSWFFLGEVFLTLDLAESQPVAELCGSCTRCLEECPTGAFPEPYRLDANRCISYWTIEHRGWLPDEAREMISEWVFGCDVCQEVCPLNEGPIPTAPAEFDADPQRRQMELAELLELTSDEYVQLFRGSAMKRAKLEGLQRNAAVVLGNVGSRRAIPALEKALGHAKPVVRGHAAWALAKLDPAGSAPALKAALEAEVDERVRAEIEAALRRV